MYPSDASSYQEIVYETKPDLIIKTGTNHGGSTVFFASLFDLIVAGRIITIDIDDRRDRPVHPRSSIFTGFSTSARRSFNASNNLPPPARVSLGASDACGASGRARRLLTIADG
jgi:cephalosporin hydroxylase